GGLSSHRRQGRQGLARVWRAGIPRVRGRRSADPVGHAVPEAGEAEARRGRRDVLDRLQVARPPRQDPAQKQAGQAPRRAGPEDHAIRCQAHVIWWVQTARGSVAQRHSGKEISTMNPIVPYLTVSNASEAIAFYKKAFDAKENARVPEEKGTRIMHA